MKSKNAKSGFKSLNNEGESSTSLKDILLIVFTIISLCLATSQYIYYKVNSKYQKQVLLSRDVHLLKSTLSPFNANRIEDQVVSGSLMIEMVNDNVRVYGEIGGLVPGSIHALHILEYSDILEYKDEMDKNKLKLIGSDLLRHYNPQRVKHSCPVIQSNIIYHAGDLGNVIANNKGIASFSILKKGELKGFVGRLAVIKTGKDECDENAEFDKIDEILGLGTFTILKPFYSQTATNGKDDYFMREINTVNKKEFEKRKLFKNEKIIEIGSENSKKKEMTVEIKKPKEIREENLKISEDLKSNEKGIDDYVEKTNDNSNTKKRENNVGEVSKSENDEASKNDEVNDEDIKKEAESILRENEFQTVELPENVMRKDDVKPTLVIPKVEKPTHNNRLESDYSQFGVPLKTSFLRNSPVPTKDYPRRLQPYESIHNKTFEPKSSSIFYDNSKSIKTPTPVLLQQLPRVPKRVFDTTMKPKPIKINTLQPVQSPIEAASHFAKIKPLSNFQSSLIDGKSIIREREEKSIRELYNRQKNTNRIKTQQYTIQEQKRKAEKEREDQMKEKRLQEAVEKQEKEFKAKRVIEERERDEKQRNDFLKREREIKAREDRELKELQAVKEMKEKELKDFMKIRQREIEEIKDFRERERKVQNFEKEKRRMVTDLNRHKKSLAKMKKTQEQNRKIRIREREEEELKHDFENMFKSKVSKGKENRKIIPNFPSRIDINGSSTSVPVAQLHQRIPLPRTTTPKSNSLWGELPEINFDDLNKNLKQLNKSKQHVQMINIPKIAPIRQPKQLSPEEDINKFTSKNLETMPNEKLDSPSIKNNLIGIPDLNLGFDAGNSSNDEKNIGSSYPGQHSKRHHNHRKHKKHNVKTDLFTGNTIDQDLSDQNIDGNDDNEASVDADSEDVNSDNESDNVDLSHLENDSGTDDDNDSLPFFDLTDPFNGNRFLSKRNIPRLNFLSKKIRNLKPDDTNNSRPPLSIANDIFDQSLNQNTPPLLSPAQFSFKNVNLDPNLLSSFIPKSVNVVGPQNFKQHPKHVSPNSLFNRKEANPNNDIFENFFNIQKNNSLFGANKSNSNLKMINPFDIGDGVKFKELSSSTNNEKSEMDVMSTMGNMGKIQNLFHKNLLPKTEEKSKLNTKDSSSKKDSLKSADLTNIFSMYKFKENNLEDKLSMINNEVKKNLKSINSDHLIEKALAKNSTSKQFKIRNRKEKKFDGDSKVKLSKKITHPSAKKVMSEVKSENAEHKINPRNKFSEPASRLFNEISNDKTLLNKLEKSDNTKLFLNNMKNSLNKM